MSLVVRIRVAGAPLTLALLVAACSGGESTGPDPEPENRAPTAVISANPTEVPEGDDHQTVVTLDGSGSSDPDGDALSYSWSVPGGTFVGGTSPSSATAQVTFAGDAALASADGPRTASAADYGVTLTVSDGRGGTDQAQTTIALGPPVNQVPVAAIALDPPEIPEGDDNQTVVTLDGSGSSDPDGDDLTFDWDVPGGTFVEDTDASSEVAKVTLPGTSAVDVTLTVDDGRGGADQAQATVTLGPPANQDPSAVIAADPTEIPEGDGNQTVVTLDGSGSSDPDGDGLTFDWDVPGGTFENVTDASSEVAQVSFPGDDDYTVTLTVDDGEGGSAQAQVTIESVPPDNQAPTAVIAADPLEIPQGDGHQTVFTLDGSGSSDPDADDLTYTWTVPGGVFEEGTDASSEIAKVTFSGDAASTVTLDVDDGRGGTDQAQVTLTLGPPANQEPQADIDASATEVPENDQNRTTLTLDGGASSDPDNDDLTFDWDLDGGSFEGGTDAGDEVVMASFPGEGEHTVTLSVSDGRGGEAQAQVTISLGDIIEREDPSFELDVQEIFQRRGCTSGACHGYSPGSAGLDLRPANAYGELVGVVATSEAIVRVIAGNAEDSYLVIKLEGRQTVGLRMPRLSTPLNAVDLANIRNWIDQGANNN